MIGQTILWVFAFVLFVIAFMPWIEPYRLRIIAGGLAFAALSHVIQGGATLLH